jgi:hypothetical protein
MHGTMNGKPRHMPDIATVFDDEDDDDNNNNKKRAVPW